VVVAKAVEVVDHQVVAKARNSGKRALRAEIRGR